MLEIWNYISAENERAAEKVLRRIGEVFRLLSSQPEIGRHRPELDDSLRSFPAGNYVVFYEPRERSVDIVRVLSGYRDITDELMRE